MRNLETFLLYCWFLFSGITFMLNNGDFEQSMFKYAVVILLTAHAVYWWIILSPEKKEEELV